MAEMKIRHICEQCGKEFWDYKCQGPRRFCCLKCKKESNKSKHVERRCKQCEKIFYVCKTYLKTNASGNFCCRKCYNKYQKTLKKERNNNCTGRWKPCGWCGKETWAIPSREEMYKDSYCSIRCRSLALSRNLAGENNSNWRGGHVERRGDFNHIKAKYFNGKNFCAICGTFRSIHIHHIIPYRHTQDNSLSNLIPLCKSCHRMVEILTWEIIDASNDDLAAAKYILNNILRTRQLATYEFIKEVHAGVANESRRL